MAGPVNLFPAYFSVIDQHYSDRMMSAYELMPNNRNICYAGCSDRCHDIKPTQAEFLYIIDDWKQKGRVFRKAAITVLANSFRMVYAPSMSADRGYAESMRPKRTNAVFARQKTI